MTDSRENVRLEIINPADVRDVAEDNSPALSDILLSARDPEDTREIKVFLTKDAE